MRFAVRFLFWRCFSRENKSFCIKKVNFLKRIRSISTLTFQHFYMHRLRIYSQVAYLNLLQINFLKRLENNLHLLYIAKFRNSEEKTVYGSRWVVGCCQCWHMQHRLSLCGASAVMTSDHVTSVWIVLTN